MRSCVSRVRDGTPLTRTMLQRVPMRQAINRFYFNWLNAMEHAAHREHIL